MAISRTLGTSQALATGPDLPARERLASAAPQTAPHQPVFRSAMGHTTPRVQEGLSGGVRSVELPLGRQPDNRLGVIRSPVVCARSRVPFTDP